MYLATEIDHNSLNGILSHQVPSLKSGLHYPLNHSLCNRMDVDV